MALDDTIRQVWARALLRNLQKTLVFGQPGVINKNYEGEVREWGDRVHIQAIGAVNVIAYTKNTDLSALQVLDDSKQTLLIDQQDAFNVFLDDIDRVQANPGLAAELSEEAAYALADDTDEFIAATMVAGATGTAVTAAALTTAGKAYEALVDAGVSLDEANIPSQGRFAVIPPWFHGVILKDDRFVSNGTPATDSRLRNGIVGEAAGFTLLKSNNVPVNGSDEAQILCGVPGATTFADQISKVESIRNDKRFGDNVRGLHVYGAEVIRPTGLVVVTAARPA